MQVKIRALKNDKISLYEVIFIPKGMTSPSKDIVEKPELWVYTDDFGKRHGDSCLIAVVDNQIVGAVWTRIMNDYGHMDDNTPSFAISLYKDYRGLGNRHRTYERTAIRGYRLKAGANRV